MAHTMSAERTRFWYALDVETEVSAREAVEYALMEAGALGTETNDSIGELVRVTGYFECERDGPS